MANREKKQVPHSQPDALPPAFTTILPPPTGNESTKNAPYQIHNRNCWCDIDESKRQFLGLE